MIGVHVFASLERTADGADKRAIARHRQKHVIRHGTDVTAHAHGDNHAVAERLVQVIRHQAGDSRALGVGVAVVDRNQSAVQLEALHQCPLQLVVHRRVLQHAHLDNPFIARTFEQAADFRPRQVEAFGDGFLSDVLKVIEHRHFGHLIDIAGNALGTVTHGDGLPFRRQRRILPTLAPLRPLLMPIALDRIDPLDLGP